MALPAVAGALGAARSLATGRLLGFILPSGKRIPVRVVRNYLLRYGLEAAALIGLNELLAAETVLTKPRRRRKGISYKDIQSARRTACMVSKMARDLNVKPAPRSRSTCR